jgi:hypothetical protein
VDTFLVTVYCLIDDVYRRYAGPVRAHLPGRPGELSDSEVLTLAVLAQWEPHGSERQFIAWAATHWRAYFPRLLSQSAFNRRARQLYGVLAQLSGWIRTAVDTQMDCPRVYEIIDGVPVPLMRRCRGSRHRSFGIEADFRSRRQRSGAVLRRQTPGRGGSGRVCEWLGRRTGQYRGALAGRSLVHLASAARCASTVGRNTGRRASSNSPPWRPPPGPARTRAWAAECWPVVRWTDAGRSRLSGCGLAATLASRLGSRGAAQERFRRRS